MSEQVVGTPTPPEADAPQAWSRLLVRLARRQQERRQGNPDAFFQGCELCRRGGCICCSSRPISDPGGAARASVHVQIAGQIAGQIAWPDPPRWLNLEVPPR
jgi:hypothetical protein